MQQQTRKTGDMLSPALSKVIAQMQDSTYEIGEFLVAQRIGKGGVILISDIHQGEQVVLLAPKLLGALGSTLGDMGIASAISIRLPGQNKTLRTFLWKQHSQDKPEFVTASMDPVKADDERPTAGPLRCILMGSIFGSGSGKPGNEEVRSISHFHIY